MVFCMPAKMSKAELSMLLLLTIPPGAEACSLVLPNVEIQSSTTILKSTTPILSLFYLPCKRKDLYTSLYWGHAGPVTWPGPSFSEEIANKGCTTWVLTSPIGLLLGICCASVGTQSCDWTRAPSNYQNWYRSFLYRAHRIGIEYA